MTWHWASSMKRTLAILAIALPSVLPAFSQNFSPSATNVAAGFWLREAPPAYRDAVFRLMLAEASTYAAQLNLPEKLPLTTASVTEKFIASPRLATGFGALGSFRTTNFSYGFGKGRHLSYVTRLPKDKSKRSPYERMKPWAIDASMVNTNAAYRLATQFLAKAFVDLPRLSTASVAINPMTVLKMPTSIYTVEWQRGGSPVVQVTFDEPKAELWTLRVEDPEYILRKPLEVSNLDSLLSQTNKQETSTPSSH